MRCQRPYRIAAALRRRCGERLRGGHGGDAGSSSLELVILFPAVLLLIFGVVQGALYFHARNVALASAREGLHAEQSSGGHAADGRARASEFLTRAGGRQVLTGVAITPNRDAAQASVTVTGRSYSIIPGVPGFQITQTARGPIERYLPAP